MHRPYSIEIKRIYEPANSDDGYRVLIDRLWPRGVTRDAARLDEWNRDIAPSPALRKWFGHKPEHFERFSELYREELSRQQDELQRLRQIARRQKITLLYGARDHIMNQATVLRDVLKKR